MDGHKIGSATPESDQQLSDFSKIADDLRRCEKGQRRHHARRSRHQRGPEALEEAGRRRVQESEHDCRADDQTGEDVARIVIAEIYPRQQDQRRGPKQRHPAKPTGSRPDRQAHGAELDRMIARETVHFHEEIRIGNSECIEGHSGIGDGSNVKRPIILDEAREDECAEDA